MKSLMKFQWKVFWKSTKIAIIPFIVQFLFWIMGIINLIVSKDIPKSILYLVTGNTYMILFTFTASIIAVNIFYNYKSEGMEYLMYSKPISRKTLYWSNFWIAFLIYLLYSAIFTIWNLLTFLFASVANLKANVPDKQVFNASHSILVCLFFFLGSIFYGFFLISIVAICFIKVKAKGMTGIMLGGVIGGTITLSIFAGAMQMAENYNENKDLTLKNKRDETYRNLIYKNQAEDDKWKYKGIKKGNYLLVDKSNADEVDAFKVRSKTQFSEIIQTFNMSTWMQSIYDTPLEGTFTLQNSGKNLNIDPLMTALYHFKKVNVDKLLSVNKGYLKWNRSGNKTEDYLYLLEPKGLERINYLFASAIAINENLEYDENAKVVITKNDLSNLYVIDSINSNSAMAKEISDYFNIFAESNDGLKVLNPALISYAKTTNDALNAKGDNVSLAETLSGIGIAAGWFEQVIKEYLWANYRDAFRGFKLSKTITNDDIKVKYKTWIDSTTYQDFLDKKKNPDFAKEIDWYNNFIRMEAVRLLYSQIKLNHLNGYVNALNKYYEEIKSNKDLKEAMTLVKIIDPEHVSPNYQAYQVKKIATFPWYTALTFFFTIGTILLFAGQKRYEKYQFKI